jgi:hypothetical protein
MIATEPTPADDPGEGSLDHPSSGLGTEPLWEKLVSLNLFTLGDDQSSFGHGQCLDCLDGPSQIEACPDAEVASVVTVSPHQLHPGKRFF